MKYFKNKLFIFLVLVILFFSFAILVQAFSLTAAPVAFFQKSADVVVRRVSDMVYYLMMQKKYIFDGFSDPNVYTPLTVSPEVERIASGTVAATVTKKPIVVTTSTLPNISKTYSESNGSEILKDTNIERVNQSLKPLSSNQVLDSIASQRVDDLFTNQYFEHASPDGKGASELAKKDGYDYLLIGENLALGDFGGDQGIVAAWMASPGHRANILNGKFTELGVSVKKGQYNGEENTIAVQIFGRPLTDCSAPNADSKTSLDSSTATLKQMQAEAKVMYDNLAAMKDNPAVDRSYYNQKIQEYNYFAIKVNTAIAALKIMIDDYNADVARFNACLGSQ